MKKKKTNKKGNSFAELANVIMSVSKTVWIIENLKGSKFLAVTSRSKVPSWTENRKFATRFKSREEMEAAAFKYGCTDYYSPINPGDCTAWEIEVTTDRQWKRPLYSKSYGGEGADTEGEFEQDPKASATWTWELDTGNCIVIREDGNDRMSIYNPVETIMQEEEELAKRVCHLLNKDDVDIQEGRVSRSIYKEEQ